MTGREIATISWGNPNSQASFYGTALTVNASGDIHFVNPLMPSGTTIQEWYSFTDFSSVRDTPALPLLHHGKRYRIDPAIDSSPPGSVIFDVRYFNRFNDLAGVDVLYPPAHEFEYPAECHHYTIRLVNAGCDTLRFTSFTLLEAGDHG